MSTRTMFFATLAATAHALSLTGTEPSGDTPHTTTTSDNMIAWNNDLSLVGLKAHQLGRPYVDFGVVTEAGTTVTIEASAGKAAVLYAFVYGCYPCPATQDGLIGHMMSVDNWRLGFCGPTFHSGFAGRQFRLISYAKDVPAGGSYTLTLPGNTHYAAFVAVEDHIECGGFQDRETCNGAAPLSADEKCKWNAVTSSCDYAFCHGNIGPILDLCPPQACAPDVSTYLA